MHSFAPTSTDFSADCACHGGRCVVAHGDFIFLDDGDELAAVGRLQARCEHVVILRGRHGVDASRLYHTSCRRMVDVVDRMFGNALGAPERLVQAASPEMSVGAMYRREVAASYDHCRSIVDRFEFAAAD